MAKSWAKAFYESALWKQQRKVYAQTKHRLCERCGAPGKIVHHKIPLTPETIDDPHWTLAFDNLELLCQSCHNAEHIAARAAGVGLYFDEDGNLLCAGGGS